MISNKRFLTLHWNIHQAAGISGKAIPDIVMSEIKKINPDVGCLTEYSKNAINAYEFETELKCIGYQTFKTNAPSN